MSTPTNRRELFAAITDLIEAGWHTMPDESPYKGTGAPGNYLEHLLGFTPGAADIPDALGWELKWHTPRTHLLTLFHKTPDNSPEIIRYMVRKYGKKDAKGRLSFRHTIDPTSRAAAQRFMPVYDAGQLVVRRRDGNGMVPRWSQDSILGAAGGKLRRLLLILGERKGQQVKFTRADAYDTFSLTDFFVEVERGVIVIDFDARESSPGSHGMRDHGTKFRVRPEHVCRLYMNKQRVR